MIRRWRSRHSAILVVAAVLAGAEAIAQDGMPRTTPEGLELIDGRFQALYWREGSTLEQYGRVAILDCLVQFREDWLEIQNRGRRSDQFTADDMAVIGDAFAVEFGEIFSEVLAEDGGYPIVDTAAPDVLVLRPAVLNLDVPSDIFGSRSPSGGASVLSMTLYLEFYDSVTGTLIGRALDLRSNPDNDRSAARRVIRRWARDARATLDEGVGGDD